MSVPTVVVLDNPSAREIRDTKLDLWRNWEAANGEPAEIIVRRGYDLTKDCRTATIVVRSTVPRGFKWSGSR